MWINGNSYFKGHQLNTIKGQVISVMIIFFLFICSPVLGATHQWNWELSFDSLLKLTSGMASNIDYRKYLNLKQDRKNDKLTVQQYSFGNLDSAINHLSTSAFETSNTLETQDIVPEVTRKPLAYPNPFRQEEGVAINYQLSTNMDILIHIYDMAGNRIFEFEGTSGGIAAKEGNNNLYLDNTTFDGYNLSAGVYFIYLIHKDKVLSKGKMAVVP